MQPIKQNLENIPSNLIIIKRDGSRENYSYDKMKKFLLRICDNSEVYANMIIEKTIVKLNKEEMKIQDLVDLIIKTTLSEVSMLYPKFDEIASKLYLTKIRKTASNSFEYPNLKDILTQGVKAKVYSPDFVNAYSEDDIEYFNSIIDPDRDYLFNSYKAIKIFHDKYCIRKSKTVTLELPQHAYMRVAMFLNHKEPYFVRKQFVKDTYNMISKHLVTMATPIMINSGTMNPQMSSCVLTKTNDDTRSILKAGNNIAIYSKFKGGTALDISLLRATGSLIGESGTSSGPVPFIKLINEIICAWNQGSTRKGACAIYYTIFHLDVFSLLPLKDNSGTETTRARDLMYSVKIDDVFIERWHKDEDYTLFDPIDVPLLFTTYGDEFKEAYEKYERTTSIRKKKIKARELFDQVLKYRVETGNLYIFFTDNVNKHNMLNDYISSSNLCSEITLPTEGASFKDEILDYQGNIVQTFESTEKIALCNLASINLERYFYMNEEERKKLYYDLVRSLDNTIDIAYYPVKAAEIPNKKNRYLGIGVSNLANYLALKELSIDDRASLDVQAELFDEISYGLIESSVQLAKEKGRAEGFNHTKYAEGLYPYKLGNEKAKALTSYKPNEEKWDKLMAEAMKFGMRNCTLMAIAPTNTSGRSINATEGCDPVFENGMYCEEMNNLTVKCFTPNFKKNREYYKIAYECNPKNLIDGAAVRQLFLDQSQSFTLFNTTNPNDKTEVNWLCSSSDRASLIHMYAHSVGLKTIYYLKSKKITSSEHVCESCS